MARSPRENCAGLPLVVEAPEVLLVQKPLPFGDERGSRGHRRIFTWRAAFPSRYGRRARHFAARCVGTRADARAKSV